MLHREYRIGNLCCNVRNVVSDVNVEMRPGCRVLQCVLQCAAVCCGVLQCVAVCSSVLQCVAVHVM